VEAEADYTEYKSGVSHSLLQGQQHRIENVAQDRGSLTSLPLEN